MPYKNIVYAKLEKRLLEDPRWYMLSETSQLNYIKLILTAQATYNRIPTQLGAIRKAFKTNQRLKTLELSLIEIGKAFPKFRKSAEYYYFEEFETKTNYIREELGSALGIPKEETDIDIDIDIEKIKRKNSPDVPKTEKTEKTDKTEKTEKTDDIFFSSIFKLYITDFGNLLDFEKWKEWVSYRSEIRKKLTKSTAVKQILFLIKQPNPSRCIDESITNGWQGLFPTKHTEKKYEYQKGDNDGFKVIGSN